MIRTENLTRIFRTEEVETIALNGVNIEVEDGEFIAIMGPSDAAVNLAEHPGLAG